MTKELKEQYESLGEDHQRKRRKAHRVIFLAWLPFTRMYFQYKYKSPRSSVSSMDTSTAGSGALQHQKIISTNFKHETREKQRNTNIMQIRKWANKYSAKFHGEPWNRPETGDKESNRKKEGIRKQCWSQNSVARALFQWAGYVGLNINVRKQQLDSVLALSRKGL